MSDLPRLLLCCFDVVPAPTAVSRRMTEYLKGMSERYQVVVLTVKTADHTHIERYHGARLLRVPVGSGDLAARVQAFDRAVRRQLESEEYVMVHFFDPFGGYALCERRPELGYKLVYDACSLPSVELPMLVDEKEANRRFLARVRRQELFCLMNADVVIVANELTRDFITGLGVAREQVLVLPPPVDLAPYAPEVMGVPDATPMRLLHLGNLSSAQDLATVLEAMQLVLQTVDVRLVVVGPPHPEHQQRLEEQVARLKLTGKVEFQQPVPHDDLHKVLATADVGLLTLADIERNSRVGSPLSRLAEYLAAGRPVLAADVAAARAMLPEDGVVLYRPQDKHSLADAIASLATDPARRVKLGAAARNGRLAFDAAKIRADLFAAYHALTGTGARKVGDADEVNPDEVTQLGRAAAEADTSKRKRTEEAPSGTNKVKTDPAISGAEQTSPETVGGDRPPVMGVPLHDEPPVVLGVEAREVVAELEQVSTQPSAVRQTEPPVVMGLPLSMPEARPELTPALLAAELDEVEAPATATAAPVADEPPPLDEQPDTDGHLSLVRPQPEITAPTTDPSTTPAPAPEPAPPVFIPPLELPPLPRAARPSAADLPGVPGRPSGAASTAELTPPEPPVGDREPAPRAPSAPPRAETTRPEAKERALEVAPRADEKAPPRSTSPAAKELPRTSPLESAPRAEAKEPASPSSLESTPAPIPELVIPPLTVPPLAEPRAPALPESVRPTSSALPPVPPRPPTPTQPPRPPPPLPVSAPPPPLPAARTSGVFPAVDLPPRPPARTSSGVFVAPVAPEAQRTTSGVFPVVPAPRSTSGVFPVVPVAPPAPVRTSSGIFVPPALAPRPSAPVPPPLPRSPSGVFAADKDQSSGLFPEPPQVPEGDEAEAISEHEIEPVGEDGPMEIGADEAEEIVDEGAPAHHDEPQEMVAEDPAVMTVDGDASPPPSAIDPWLAQLVHGYCPPESGLFERHTPPTTMPGRDT